jgi:hypothetical protein
MSSKMPSLNPKEIDIASYYVAGKFISRAPRKNGFFKNTFTRRCLRKTISIASRIVVSTYSLKKRPREKRLYDVALCAIFKDESRYLNEWLAYHISIGIQHFYLYNNNSSDDYLKEINYYIQQGYVSIVEWPYTVDQQMAAYKHCFEHNRDSAKWIGFIDIDEFICPKVHRNIKVWLDQYLSYPSVAIYWKQFGGSGILVENKSKLVIEQYYQAWSCLSDLTKTFLNTDFDVYNWNNPHHIYGAIFGIPIPPINQFQHFIALGINKYTAKDKHDIQINHYWNKSYSSFEEKIRRGCSTGNQNDHDKAIILKELLIEHELLCTSTDHTICRFLLNTKLLMSRKT